MENAKGQIITSSYDPVFGRTNRMFQTGKISVHYGYEKGNLGTLKRGGYITPGGTKQNQTYSFAYDEFGNRTAAYIGDRQLASYAYNSGNGTLKNLSYGLSGSAIAKVDYSYDKLDRVKTAAYQDTNSGTTTTYGYRYNADGNLSGITEAGKLKYTYEYDSLGRLIYSSRLNNGNLVLHTKHRYDTSDRITNQSWQIGNEAFSENYIYSTTDGTLTSMTTGGDSLGFTYNNLKQLSKRTSPKLDMSYSYRTRDNTNKLTTNQVETVQYLKHGTATQLLPTLKYTYDSLWNITKVEEGTATAAQYTYDEQNQLVTAVLPTQTSDYVYDTYGNIRSKTNSYSDGTTDSYTYSYEDGDWLDLLTKVSYTDKNGTTATESLTYDIIGNPLSYFNGKKNWTFTWKNGRQLSTATDGTITVTNTYDVDGLRETKTVNGVKHTYTYLGEKLARETYGNNVIDYFYDADGRPYKFTVKEDSATYTGYFVLNLQGDVIAIIDSDGTVAVEYEYDAWGKEIGHTTSGSHGSKLYEYNALKYRGYYYDAETGFYYVSSRYYDPEVGRFISADTVDLVLASQSILTDKNLFAYCDNNPIMRVDTTGYAWETVFDAISLAESVLATMADPRNPYNWIALAGDTIDFAIPFIAGIGESARLLKTAKAIDKIEIAKIATTGTPNKMGKIGEALAGINQNAKTSILVNGRTRIPDALTGTELIEVKNVKRLYNTRQLRDFADYAKAEKLSLVLWVRPTTKVSKTVINAGWKIQELW